MRRAVHELALLVAILVMVFTTPVLAIRGLTMAFGTWPGEQAPEWWDRASLAAAGLFMVAATFLIWDTFRISRIERDGVIVERLRMRGSRRAVADMVRRGRPVLDRQPAPDEEITRHA